MRHTWDRRSRPVTCLQGTQVRIERRLVGTDVVRRWVPPRIVYRLHLNISTVHRILARYLCPLPRFTDPATRIRARGRDGAHRYEYPGQGK